MYMELSRNPFEEEYYLNELSSLKLQNKKYKNVEIQLVTIQGRVDGYMYDDYLLPIENVPILFINGELWMSLTPMEVQSHYMPIALAGGRVGVGGLGLGYYVNSILELDIVDEVIVYELNQDVIDFYYENFGKHSKLTIIKQDVRTIENEYFDFFYCDIYPQQMDFQAIEDMALITSKNDISDYHFWTLEQMILEMMEAGYTDVFPFSWRRVYFPFLNAFVESKGNVSHIRDVGEELFEAFQEHDIL